MIPSGPEITVTPDGAGEPIGGRRGCLLAQRRPDQPGAAVHFETANVGGGQERGLVTPQPAKALGVNKRDRSCKPGAIKREIAVAGDAVEIGGIAKLGLIEASHALAFSTREGCAAMEARAIEAPVAEETHASEGHRGIEGAIDEPGQALKHRIAQGKRCIKNRSRKIEVGQQSCSKLDRLIDNEAAQILELSAPQRRCELGAEGVHAVPAAPAGGPAKLFANGPTALISTSINCGPMAPNARSSAAAKSSLRTRR